MVQNLKLYRNPPDFRGRSVVVVQLWWIVESVLFRCSPQFMYGWRRFLLRAFGAKIGDRVLIRPGVQVTYPWKLIIGDDCWIGNGSKLYTLGPITIGSNVAIAEDVHLITGSHKFRSEAFEIYAEPIVVEDQCWLCNGVFVHQGVRMRKGSVAGARAMIQADTEEYSINVGAPSRPVGDRRMGQDA